jgi:hypothetical protein
MQQPPLLPEHVLARVTTVAHRNGLSVLLIASIAAVLEASRGSVFTAVVGVLAAGAGAMEVHGASLLRHGSKRGVSFCCSPSSGFSADTNWHTPTSRRCAKRFTPRFRSR